MKIPIVILSAIILNGQAKAQKIYIEQVNKPAMVYFHHGKNLYAFNNLVPQCFWSEIKDSTVRLSVYIEGREIDFGLVHTSYLSSSRQLHFIIGKNQLVPPIIYFHKNYALSTISNRDNPQIEGQNELYIECDDFDKDKISN